MQDPTNNTREVLGFRIEANIPIPTRVGREGFGREKKYPFDTLGVGESFFVPGKTAGKLSSCCAAWHKKLGWKFVGRTVNGGARVWRIK